MNAPVTIDSSLTRWSPASDTDRPLLVMLHGYGADERDLAGLVPYLPGGIAVASLAAPLRAPFPLTGRAWFPLAVADGAVAELAPTAADASARALLDWLDAHTAAAPSVALLGFSQGGMVALQAMRLAPERFGAVVALSTGVPGGDVPGDTNLRVRRPAVFWGRGTLDTVIPAALVDHTSRWLPEHSTLTERVYPGLAHGISEQEVADIRAFLSEWTASIEG